MTHGHLDQPEGLISWLALPPKAPKSQRSPRKSSRNDEQWRPFPFHCAHFGIGVKKKPKRKKRAEVMQPFVLGAPHTPTGPISRNWQGYFFTARFAPTEWSETDMCPGFSRCHKGPKSEVMLILFLRIVELELEKGFSSTVTVVRWGCRPFSDRIPKMDLGFPLNHKRKKRELVSSFQWINASPKIEPWRTSGAAFRHSGRGASSITFYVVLPRLQLDMFKV